MTTDHEENSSNPDMDPWGDLLEEGLREDSGDAGPTESVAGREARDRPSLPSRIGPFTILEELGEGGMGTVYLAEQEQPVRRRVALKVIKPGMDTKEVVARFEAERQALAMMDHPNVAKVFEAGATEQGQPYFAMEYVRGIPITAYCDKHRLGTPERLELFMQVCQAIQHAHQKGIIHRDISPSNVLVAVQDDKPVPKVIDFGVAKATDHRLTQKTIFTEQGRLIGKPEYMSPEQAEMSKLDIDTRTDIYSLGVVLYELLVGTLPFDPAYLKGGGFLEIQRIIREEDPPKPSTRLSTLGEESTHFAKARRTDPKTLTNHLRGDLDWITMMAMDKDRTRRYATASELAADIARHLNDEPVLASPPSVPYRVKKTLRKHRGPVAAVAAVLLALTVGLVLSTTMYWKAESARVDAEQARDAERKERLRADKEAQEAEQQRKLAEAEKGRATAEAERAAAQAKKAQRINQFLQTMLGSAGRGGTRADATARAALTVREVLDKAANKVETELADEPEVRAAVHHTLAASYYGLYLYQPADKHARRALALRRQIFGQDEHLDVADTLALLGFICQGGRDEAVKMFREAYAIRRKRLGEKHPLTVKAFWAMTEFDRTVNLRSDPLSQPVEVLYMLTGAKRSKQEIRKSLEDMLTRTRDLWRAGQHDGARMVIRKYIAPYTKVPLFSRQIPEALTFFAHKLMKNRDYDVAEPMLREAAAVAREVFGDQHLLVAFSLRSLGYLLRDRGDYVAAERACREALAIARKVLGNEDPQVLSGLGLLARILQLQGKYAEAERLSREALKIRRRILPEGHRDIAGSLIQLGVILTEGGDAAGAEDLLRECLEIRRKQLPEGDWLIASARSALGSCLSALGQYKEAEPLLVESYPIMKAALGEADFRSLVALDRIIGLYEAWNKPDKAVEYQAMRPRGDRTPTSLTSPKDKSGDLRTSTQSAGNAEHESHAQTKSAP